MAETEKCSHTLDGRSLCGVFCMSLQLTKSAENDFNAAGAASLRLSMPTASGGIVYRALAVKVYPLISFYQSLSSDCNLNLDTRLNVNNYLLHNLRRCIETRFITTISNCLSVPENPPPPIFLPHWRNLLNQTLVNAHLECIPSLTPLTTGSLPRGDLQAFGRETDRTLDAEILALRTLNELLADLFEALNFARCQGDADLVDFL